MSALLQKKGNNAAKMDLRYNSKPVAGATGYKNITPTGVSGFVKVIIISNREWIRFGFVSIVAEN